MEFYKDTLFFLFLLQLQYFDCCEAVVFSEDCSQNANKADNTILKIVFVVDQTNSFTPVRDHFIIAMPVLGKEVTNIYQDTEWGLAAFSDYPKDAKPDLGDDETNPHNLKEGCYARRQTFTNSYKTIANTFRSIQRPIRNGGKEDSLHALAQSVVDLKIDWEANTEGKTVKNLAILLTDRGYGNVSNPENRHAYIGDGTDMCTTSIPATIQQVGDILKKKNVAVIGLLPFGTFEPNVLQTYEQYFQQMSGVPFCGKTFNMATESNPETIVNSIMSCIKQLC